MSAPYIPVKDALFSNWLLNFSTLITASPSTYGLLAGDATTIAAQNTLWVAAYALAVAPGTRTPTTVAAKDATKVTALATVRPYAQRISKNAGVAPSLKVSLGVNPGTNVPTPIAAPTTQPELTIGTALALQHVIRYRDSAADPSSKAKPFGTIGMQLFGKASATPITDPAALEFLQIDTKSPLLTTWLSGDVGKVAYYAGRWFTRTGLVGPWSTVTSFTIAG